MKYTVCIIRMTITMEFNSMIYTLVVTISLAPTLYVHGAVIPDATTDTPGIHNDPFISTLDLQPGPLGSTPGNGNFHEPMDENTDINPELVPGKENIPTVENGRIDVTESKLVNANNADFSTGPENSNFSTLNLTPHIDFSPADSIPHSVNFISTEGNVSKNNSNLGNDSSTAANLTLENPSADFSPVDLSNSSFRMNLVRNRRSVHLSTRRRHTTMPSTLLRDKKYSRYLKVKYDYKTDPPPYMWTFDPTRETIKLWEGTGPNPFSFAFCKFDTQEAVENYKRELEKAHNRPGFENMTGPVPLRHPNGTRIKVKRKYSWVGDDNVSAEAQFHRNVFREIEEHILSNESVSSDSSMGTTRAIQTKRIRVRTRAKYHGWTYMTCAPGVSWSPDVPVNTPASDLFYSSEFGPAGPETVEEYYGMSCETPDYNDSLYHLPDDLSDRPDTSKYNAIYNKPLPRESELWQTLKSHYDSHELYNDYPIVIKNSTTKKTTKKTAKKTHKKTNKKK